MAEVKWIKIVTDVFDDEKTLMIESLYPSQADSILIIWFKLLCLAGKQNNSGVFQMGKVPYTEEMFSAVFRRPVKTVKLALAVFEQFGMIEIVSETVTIPNWDKHQSLDTYEKRKERDRLYQAERRANQKKIAKKSVDASADESSDVGVLDKKRLEEDKKRKEEREKESIEADETTAPSLEDIITYVSENNLNVNAQKFYEYYDKAGWQTTKGNTFDWKAKIKEWSTSERPAPKNKSSNPFYDLLKNGETYE